MAIGTFMNMDYVLLVKKKAHTTYKTTRYFECRTIDVRHSLYKSFSHLFPGERLVATYTSNYSYTRPTHVAYTLQYPGKGEGLVVIYVKIVVEQVKFENRRHVAAIRLRGC